MEAADYAVKMAEKYGSEVAVVHVARIHGHALYVYYHHCIVNLAIVT